MQNRRSLIRKNQYENVILYADEHDGGEEAEEEEEEGSSDGSYFSGSEFDDTDDELYDLNDLSEDDDSSNGTNRSVSKNICCLHILNELSPWQRRLCAQYRWFVCLSFCSSVCLLLTLLNKL